MISLKYIVLCFEFTTLLVALLYIKKHKAIYFKFFIAYAAVTLIVEYLGNIVLPKNNGYIYNIYTFFEFNLVAIIYYFLSREKYSKNFITYVSIFFNVLYALSFYSAFIKQYLVLALAFILSLFMVLYYKELLNSDKIVNYKKNLSFWMTTGMFFYYLTTIPFLALVYLTELKNDEVNFIIRLITIATHSCFIIGIIWSQRKVN